jgi:hypothetical protein
VGNEKCMGLNRGWGGGLAAEILHPTLLYSSHEEDMSVKVKVKLSLCLTKHQAMKAYWESGGIAPRIF